MKWRGANMLWLTSDEYYILSGVDQSVILVTTGNLLSGVGQSVILVTMGNLLKINWLLIMYKEGNQSKKCQMARDKTSRQSTTHTTVRNRKWWPHNSTLTSFGKLSKCIAQNPSQPPGVRGYVYLQKEWQAYIVCNGIETPVKLVSFILAVMVVCCCRIHVPMFD